MYILETLRFFVGWIIIVIIIMKNVSDILVKCTIFFVKSHCDTQGGPRAMGELREW